MKFNNGDKIVRKDGDSFSNGEYVVTVKFHDGGKVWIKETGTFISEDSIELFDTKLGEETKLENKLIKTKQVPVFNGEAIKKGMFISVEHKGCGPVNGIISLVTEDHIYYFDRVGTDNYVLIANVVEGTTQIKIANSLEGEK